MISASIETWTWRSIAVLAAELAPDGTIRRANPALERLAGRPLGGTAFAELVAPSQHRALARRLAAADDGWRSATFAFMGAPGRPAMDRRLWLARAGEDVLVVGEPAVDEQEHLVAKVLELNDELVSTHRELVRQRSAAEAGAKRIRHLEAIAAAGLAGLDLGVVLQDVLRVIVRAVDAQSGSVLLLEDGELVVRAVIGEPGDQEVAEAIAVDGRPRIVRAEGVAGVPLVFDGAVQGVLQVRGESFDHSDLRLLLPAAERAALAISRAQLLERERAIAETLQRALLPERLPSVPGLALAAHFEPAAGAVGGDWYDAVELDSGDVALAIGDVAGKGIAAAALMGEVRGGARAGVLGGAAPDAVLRGLDRLADRAERMVTALVVLLDPTTGTLRHASAGHPPPLLIEPDGTTRFLDAGTAPPLLAYDPAAGTGETTLAPGARLLLYTDGIVERRGEPLDTSLSRLAAVAAAHRGPLTGLAGHLLTALPLAQGALRDDIALLAVERDILPDPG
jgi:serine phosphatase RsbU (regulator of sigma subunit)